ncbi:MULTISPECIES: heavy metal sensor histidine kinase [unclassified Variovorax]|uniref:heavy metal sensor histidine kinase n=1 Tax=unclassified Variovorax TaxID=663243 RepID=UPI00076BE3EB|nr:MULTISPECIES: heavy metal sensor histidine kinase [unclassified Variovorax]KWT97321.1 Heavy metal sensor histidine kinase [Variovorax sp. WDL1]PNG48936.1 Sensor kinase CusS [Variovorax sp. B4]PNG49794.1 Sensor kinase CusS [Variovorax sp. B2]PNG50641.1 Sensor kinase CusS [Variovorax sp. B2]PNG50666.1 Sensor kinase CusS [Variovorax sp. B4]
MSKPSIQTLLSRWFAALTLIGLSIACAAVYAATRWSFQLKQSEQFTRYNEIVRHVVDETNSPPNIDALRHKLDDYFLSNPDATVDLSAGGRLIYRSQQQPFREHPISRVSSLEGLSFDDKPIELRITIDVTSDELLLRRLAWTLFGAASLGSLVVALTGATVVRRGLKPLKLLAAQTAAAGPSQLGARIDPSGFASELQPWIRQFNSLLERVEGAYGQLEAFNADVAHELRTPLSNMIAQAEIELSQSRSVEALQDALSSQLEEAQRLSSIVTDMLFLSKADRGASARRSGPVRMAEQVAAVAEFHEAELESEQLSLQVDGDAELEVDIGLLRRALSNLVSNAIRYAEPASSIRVRIRPREGGVSLVVENRGVTIDPKALPHLFERFYRADKARSGSSSHHGLGLTIVAAIARMHGGSTFAESANGVTRIGLVIAEPEPRQRG